MKVGIITVVEEYLGSEVESASVGYTFRSFAIKRRVESGLVRRKEI